MPGCEEMSGRFYLIENMMGFERPVEQGTLAQVQRKKKEYEKRPALRRVGPASGGFLKEATYYIVPKDEWDIHNCPLIPVDLA